MRLFMTYEFRSELMHMRNIVKLYLKKAEIVGTKVQNFQMVVLGIPFYTVLILSYSQTKTLNLSRKP